MLSVRKTVYMSSAVCRKDDWKYTCGYVNFQIRSVCYMCAKGKAEGVVMTSTNMTCRRGHGAKGKAERKGRRRKRKSRKFKTATTNVDTA